MFSKETYIRRRETLKKTVGSGLILLPGNNELPYNYPGNTFPFRQDSTFLYFVGIDEPGLSAVLDCDSGAEYLFGDDLTIDDIIWNGATPSMSDKASLSGIGNARQMKELRGLLSSYKGKIHFINPYQGGIALLLSDLLNVPASQLKERQSIELIKAIVSMRIVKDMEEIVEIGKAVVATTKMHLRAMAFVGENWGYGDGATERDVVAEISKVALSKGYYHSFPPIVTMHGEVFHSHGYHNKLEEGGLLLVDAGAESLEHYAGDMTRTMPVSGKFSTRQREIYDIVAEANYAVIDNASPRVTWLDMHNLAASVIAAGLRDLGLMKGNIDDIVATGAYALFFPHGIGHLMGLDVHDMENYGEDLVGYNDTVKRSTIFGPNCLRYALDLRENMVLTDEPGIYFIPQLIDQWRAQGKFADFINYDAVEKYKGFGGIRIEDDIRITDDGCSAFDCHLPKAAPDVEDVILRHSIPC